MPVALHQRHQRFRSGWIACPLDPYKIDCEFIVSTPTPLHVDGVGLARGLQEKCASSASAFRRDAWR